MILKINRFREKGNICFMELIVLSKLENFELNLLFQKTAR
jgi:hypothetical protein